MVAEEGEGEGEGERERGKRPSSIRNNKKKYRLISKEYVINVDFVFVFVFMSIIPYFLSLEDGRNAR